MEKKKNIASGGQETLAARAAATGARLAARRLTLALAESCTGGLLAAALTETPGCSSFFRGGWVAYHDRLKKKALRVRPTLLRRHGAVSAEVARAMARGARKAAGSDLAVAVTGIAGPGGAVPGKPAGLTFIAVAARRQVQAARFLFSGDRARVREKACRAALDMLDEFLQAADPGRS